MHDMLEGIVPFEMALVLQQLLAEGHFTLEHLNSIVASWPYGPHDRQNKPVALALGDKIRQNAGRMWCLLWLLPLMNGSLIPKDNGCLHFLDNPTRSSRSLCLSRSESKKWSRFFRLGSSRDNRELHTYHRTYLEDKYKVRDYPRIILKSIWTNLDKYKSFTCKR